MVDVDLADGKLRMEWFKCKVTEEMIHKAQVLNEAFEEGMRKRQGLKLDSAVSQALLETFSGLLNGHDRECFV